MAEMPHFDSLTLCPDYRFIRVVSEEGVFYDLVRKWRSREHVFLMKQQYLDARSVSRATVPPCIFRDFTDLGDRDSFHESVWREGTRFLFPAE